MYLGHKESTGYNLGESVVSNLAMSLSDSYCTLLFNKFFFSPNLIQALFEKTFTVLKLSDDIGKACQYFHQTNISKEVTVDLKHAKMYFVSKRA